MSQKKTVEVVYVYLKLPPRGSRERDLLESEVWALHVSGKTHREICAKLNLSKGTVYNILDNYEMYRIQHPLKGTPGYDQFNQSDARNTRRTAAGP